MPAVGALGTPCIPRTQHLCLHLCQSACCVHTCTPLSHVLNCRHVRRRLCASLTRSQCAKAVAPPPEPHRTIRHSVVSASVAQQCGKLGMVPYFAPGLHRHNNSRAFGSRSANAAVLLTRAAARIPPTLMRSVLRTWKVDGIRVVVEGAGGDGTCTCRQGKRTTTGTPQQQHVPSIHRCS
jgi:hypothetical protein